VELPARRESTIDATFWKDRPVLITGCTGFLGSWLTLRLVEAGAKVTGLVRDEVADSNFSLCRLGERVTLVRGQVQDRQLLERVLNEYEVDTCFHLAAQAIVGTARRSPLATFETNIAGTWCLLESVRSVDAVQRVIIASSDKAYGVYPEDRLPYREDYPLQGSYPYDVSKSCADLIAQCYAHTYWREGGPALAITRCGNLYGGGDIHRGRLVPDVLMALARREPVVLRSHGRHVRDFLYVLDAVDAYLTLAERVDQYRGSVWNFGSENPVSVLDLITVANEVTGVEIAPRIPSSAPAPGEILAQYLDCSKARAELGWRTRYDLRSGLRDAATWYEAYVNHRHETDFAALDRELLCRYDTI